MSVAAEKPVCQVCEGKPALELVSERKASAFFGESPGGAGMIRIYRCPVCGARSAVSERATDNNPSDRQRPR